jgi:hypothetical protein
MFFCGGIRGKPKDIVFIIKLKAKCLSLAMVSSWRKSFVSKEVSESKVQLEKFKKHPKIF